MTTIRTLALLLLFSACTQGRPSAAPSSSAPVPSTTVPSTTAPATSTPSSAPVPNGFDPVAVSFLSAEQGWALGRWTCPTTPCASVVRTADGGRTWTATGGAPATRVTETEGRGYVGSLAFLTGRDGWAYGTEAYVTHDGGDTWRAVTLPDGRMLLGIAATGGTALALLGRCDEASCTDVAVWRAPVGSESFTRADAGAGRALWGRAGFAVSGRSAYYLRSDSTYRFSGDGGQTWTTRRNPCPGGLRTADIAAATERDVFFQCATASASGEQAVLASADAGTTVTVRERARRRGGCCPEIAAGSATAVAVTEDTVGGSGVLLASADGGRTFRVAGPVEPQTEATLWRGLAHTGTFGTVLRTTQLPSGESTALFVTNGGTGLWTEVPIR